MTDMTDGETDRLLEEDRSNTPTPYGSSDVTVILPRHTCPSVNSYISESTGGEPVVTSEHVPTQGTTYKAISVLNICDQMCVLVVLF